MRFVDPYGESVDLSSLSGDERNLLIDDLNEFTGNTYRISDGGLLDVGEYGEHASRTATEFLDAVIGSADVHTVLANNRSSVKLGEANLETDTVTLDFADFSDINYGDVDSRTLNTGAVLVHELVHTYKGWSDRPHGDDFPGPVVGFVNMMRTERGFPTRGPKYTGTESATGRVMFNFQNVKKGKPNRVSNVKVKLFGP